MESSENRLDPTAQLETRIAAIEDRNRKVELDKAWETSLARKLTILFLTYAVMSLVFWQLDSSNFLLNAIVPTLGFFLSTLSLPIVRKIWKGNLN